MKFVAIKLNQWGIYSLKEVPDMKMCILGSFFVDEIGCDDGKFFKDWALKSTESALVSGNSTVLERDRNDILLSDEYPIEPIPTVLKMTVAQFIQLFDEWQEKVVKLRPKEVIIKNDHGLFWMETFDE